MLLSTRCLYLVAVVVVVVVLVVVVDVVAVQSGGSPKMVSPFHCRLSAVAFYLHELAPRPEALPVFLQFHPFLT